MVILTRRRRRRSRPSGPNRPVAPIVPSETGGVFIVFLRRYRLAPKSSALIGLLIRAPQRTPKPYVRILLSPPHSGRYAVQHRLRIDEEVEPSASTTLCDGRKCVCSIWYVFLMSYSRSFSQIAGMQGEGRFSRGQGPRKTPRRRLVVGLGRVELPTNGLGNRCSIHLSYRPAGN
jgi:hypothetical protein